MTTTVDLPKADPSQRLLGRQVQLRPVLTRDYEALYLLSSRPETGFRWRFRGRTPAPEDFSQALWEGTFAQFVVSPVDDQTVVGLVSGYGANISRYAYFGAVMDPDWTGTGLGIEALGLFLDHVFRCWDFRKLYAEIPDYNLEQVKSALGELLVEEGLLREHDYLDGAYHDLHILGLYRERWQQVWPELARFMRSRR